MRSFIVDVEIVDFRPESTVSSFSVLQQRAGIHHAAESRRSSIRVYFYVFDLFYENGRDLRSQPLSQRKEALKTFLKFNDSIRYMSHKVGGGETYYAEARRQRWEGLIAKRADIRYVSGRSPSWMKFKCIQEQKFVIGGFTEPKGTRDHFGALLLGHCETKAISNKREK